jgi:hypothetical protein
MFSWRFPKITPRAQLALVPSWTGFNTPVQKVIEFPNQYVYDEYCSKNNIKIGDLLTWEVCADVKSVSHPSISIALGWQDDYTDLTYDNKGNPKWLKLLTVYSHDKTYSHTRYDSSVDFRHLRPTETAWVQDNVQLANQLRVAAEANKITLNNF